ncbi:MAG: uncharacterized protein H6Q73_3802 [Firmicutes bacterium]|nr:uncharacterized protein [Bacillota bacterium]
MILTPENYYSREASLEYMSVSQYKSFLSCEAATIAALNGELEQETKEAFLEGSFVHAWSEGALDKFIINHPEIISSRGPSKGELKAGFKKCEEMIAVLENDPYCMFVLQGDKEITVTADLFGTKWKGKIDVLNADRGYFVELKTARSISETAWMWSEAQNKNIKVSFIEQYNYMVQAAVYAELERLQSGRDKWLDPVMVAVTKEDPPDHSVINLKDHERMAEELEKVKQNMPRILAVKSGAEPPHRCGMCKYCRATKRIEKMIYYTELMPA